MVVRLSKSDRDEARQLFTEEPWRLNVRANGLLDVLERQIQMGVAWEGIEPVLTRLLRVEQALELTPDGRKAVYRRLITEADSGEKKGCAELEDGLRTHRSQTLPQANSPAPEASGGNLAVCLESAA